MLKLVEQLDIRHFREMDPRAYAFQFFVSRGWTPEQAAGIVGNLAIESYNVKTKTHLDPTVRGDGGAAFGIAQWHGQRQKNLMQWAAANKVDYKTRWAQLAFVDHELKTTEKRAGDLLRTAKTVPEATALVTKHYERPSIPHLDKRTSAAMSVFGAGPVEAGAVALAEPDKTPVFTAENEPLPFQLGWEAPPAPAMPDSGIAVAAAPQTPEIPTNRGIFSGVEMPDFSGQANLPDFGQTDTRVAMQTAPTAAQQVLASPVTPPSPLPAAASPFAAPKPPAARPGPFQRAAAGSTKAAPLVSGSRVKVRQS